MPLLISLSALFGSAAVALIPIWLAAIFALVFGLGLLFFLVSAIRWFIQKKVKWGLAALGCLLCCLLALAPAVMAMFFGSMLAEDLDNFANELTLPKNVVLLDPTSQPPHSSQPERTGFFSGGADRNAEDDRNLGCFLSPLNSRDGNLTP